MKKSRKAIIISGAAALAAVAAAALLVIFVPDKNYYLSRRKSSPQWKAPSGSFLQPWYCGGWSEEKFAEHFRELKELGADKIVIQWTSETPDGKIDSVFYDTSLPEEYFTKRCDKHPFMLENCLKAAQKEGVKVFIGLNLADEWWDKTVKRADWRERQNAVAAAMAKEIYDLYKAKYPDAFYGWYWAWELTNGFPFRDEAAAFMNADIAALDALDSSVPLLFSPFNSSNSGYKSAGREWKDFLSKTDLRPGDILCLQDTIGAGWIGMNRLEYYYASVKQAAETKPGLLFWANCESFNKDYTPAPVDRFERQLDAAAYYADEVISFSLSHYYMNPQYTAQPGEDYRAMLERRLNTEE